MRNLNKHEILVLDILLKKKSGHFTYPGEVGTLSQHRISRKGAGDVCERLTGMGILHSEKKRSPTHSKPTPHYRLAKDKKSFIKLVENYFQTLIKCYPFPWQTSAIPFMSSQHVISLINSDLVRNVLSSKIITEQDSNSNNQVKKVSKVILGYHENIAEKNFILPILALIQISPTALKYFLSDWEPYLKKGVKSSSSLSFDMIEHVLFRLVWDTIIDLSLIRVVYNDSFVQTALVSGGTAPISKSSPLLHLLCKDLLSIKYEAGFDNMYHLRKKGGKFVRVKINPENCRVKIILKKERSTKI